MQENTPPMRCLDEALGADLLLYGLGQLDPARTHAFEAHLWTCLSCQTQWFEMAPHLDDLRQNRATFCQHLRSGLADEEKVALRIESPPARDRGLRFLSWRPSWLQAAALILLVGLAAVFLLKTGKPRLHSPAPGERSALHLIEPIGDLEHPPEIFRWEGVAGAYDYQIQIRDHSTGAKLTVRTPETYSKLPSAGNFSHQAGRFYSWTVEAFDEKNQPIATATGDYKLVRQP